MNNNYPKQKKPIYVCAIKYTKESNNIESIEKQIKLAKEFEPEFKELYNNLTQRFTFEFEKKDFNEKIEFLEFLINEITESLIKAKNKFSLISESSINKVESLRDTFERELNKVYINNAETNKSSIKDKPKKEFKDLINKKYNWNDAEIETIKKDLLRGFQNNIVFAYNKGGKGKRELFNYVILYLMKNKIIDDRNFKDSECIKVFEDLFFDKKVDSFYANFIRLKSNVGLDISKLNTSNYKKIFEPKISQIEKSNHLFKVR
jgi:hypothetical protein